MWHLTLSETFDTWCDNCHSVWHLSLRVPNYTQCDIWHLVWQLALSETFDTWCDNWHSVWYLTLGVTIDNQCDIWRSVTVNIHSQWHPTMYVSATSCTWYNYTTQWWKHFSKEPNYLPVFYEELKQVSRLKTLYHTSWLKNIAGGEQTTLQQQIISSSEQYCLHTI